MQHLRKQMSRKDPVAVTHITPVYDEAREPPWKSP